MAYRLYIDESGDHGYGNLADKGGQYLAITGSMIETEVYRTQFHPDLERLKQKFFPYVNVNRKATHCDARKVTHSLVL